MLVGWHPYKIYRKISQGRTVVARYPKNADILRILKGVLLIPLQHALFCF